MECDANLAIVTGGASGLGRAFCRRLAIEGWYVVVADQDEAGSLETLAQMKAAAHMHGAAQTTGARRDSGGDDVAGEYVGGEYAPLDVRDLDAWLRLRDRLRSERPNLRLLVNNAGICASGEVGASDPDVWRTVMEVNFLGPVWGCHALLGWLKESAQARGSARIVNVASIAGVVAAPGMGAYSAAKAAVAALSESLYCELWGSGVEVRSVLPGFFASNLLQHGSFAHRRHYALAQRLTKSSRFSADDVVSAALAPMGRLHVVVGGRSRFLGWWRRIAPQSLLHSTARRYRKLIADPIDKH